MWLKIYLVSDGPPEDRLMSWTPSDHAVEDDFDLIRTPRGTFGHRWHVMSEGTDYLTAVNGRGDTLIYLRFQISLKKKL